jgi:hypothetical protein
MNKEKHNEANRRYRIKHKEEIRDYMRIYKRNHKGKNRERHNELQKQYCMRHKEEIKQKVKIKGLELKTIIINHYGGCCACCGEKQLEFLAIDHVDQSGAKHRRKVGSGHRFYNWLKKNNYPLGFRVLCFNCNWALGIYGYCPHGDISVEKIETTDSLPLFENKGAYA